MIKRFLFSALSAVLLLSPAHVANADIAETPDARILKRDFTRMMEWFPGVYDNQEQVYFEDEMGVDESLRHNRIHHIFVPVELENFPGKTFYIQQSQNGDLADIYRQRIYSFSPDFEENAIRLTIYTPKDASGLVDAHVNPEKLEGLDPKDFRTLKGCDVFWKAESNFFHGYMKEGACRVKSQRSGKTLIITDDLQLTQDAIWIRDEASDANGNYVFGNKAGIHHKNRKARPFKCWLSIKKKDGSFTFHPNVKVHDQGGRAWIDAEEAVHPRVGIKIRNVVWPYGNNRPSLVLYVYQGDDADRAVSYAWTTPEADRIGINLRFVQGSCTLDPDGHF